MADPLDIYNMNGSPGMASADTSSISARLARVEGIVPYQLRGGKFAAQKFNAFTPIISSGMTDGKLNLGDQDSISFKGILSPNVVDGQFAVASPSDSTAVIYWDGTNTSRVLLIRRPDSQGVGLNGTSTTVPPNNLTISGLTPAVKYQILPYWAPFNGCGIGFAPGTAGTPLIAFASTDSDTLVNQGRSIQSLAGREPLGNVSWTQPTAGGTTAAGPPGVPPTRSPGTCVRLGTHIEPLGSYRPSEIEELLHPQEDWIHIESRRGLVLEGTPDHVLYHAEKWKLKMELFAKGEYAITRFGEDQLTEWYPFKRACTKVQVKMKFGHLFWANGFLSHNIKLPSS